MLDTPAKKQGRVQAYVDSHPELSGEDRDAILHGKMYIGLPLEAAQVMSDGMVLKDEVVSENGRLQVWFNGWFDLYFKNGSLVMWRKR